MYEKMGTLIRIYNNPQQDQNPQLSSSPLMVIHSALHHILSKLKHIAHGICRHSKLTFRFSNRYPEFVHRLHCKLFSQSWQKTASSPIKQKYYRNSRSIACLLDCFIEQRCSLAAVFPMNQVSLLEAFDSLILLINFIYFFINTRNKQTF